MYELNTIRWVNIYREKKGNKGQNWTVGGRGERGMRTRLRETQEVILATKSSEGITKLHRLPKCVLRYKQGPALTEAF